MTTSLRKRVADQSAPNWTYQSSGRSANGGICCVTLASLERCQLSDKAEPSSVFPPWLDTTTISAANARDVIERQSRRPDDRTFEQRSADATGARVARAATSRVKWRFTINPAKVAKPRPKRERTDEMRAYFREYQRRLRAKAKAEAVSPA